MKIYAIGYEEIDGQMNYYIYTDKWLSEKEPINATLYDELKTRFTLAHRNNKSLSGIYFPPEL